MIILSIIGPVWTARHGGLEATPVPLPFPAVTWQFDVLDAMKAENPAGDFYFVAADPNDTVGTRD